MENKPVYTLHLINLSCFITDEIGDDEVFLRFNGSNIWPEDKKFATMSNGTHKLDVRLPNIPANTETIIELWDFDLISPNDKLGIFRMVIDKPGGPFNTDLQANTSESTNAKYNLEWQILAV